MCVPVVAGWHFILLFRLNGCRCRRNGCQDKKGYSGTAIFTKQVPIAVTKGLGIPKHDVEGRVLTAEYSKFFVVSTYIPNSGMQLETLEYRCVQWLWPHRD
jgi:exonuclease III